MLFFQAEQVEKTSSPGCLDEDLLSLLNYVNEEKVRQNERTNIERRKSVDPMQKRK